MAREGGSSERGSDNNKDADKDDTGNGGDGFSDIGIFKARSRCVSAHKRCT